MPWLYPERPDGTQAPRPRWCSTAGAACWTDGAFQQFSLEYTRRVLAQLKRTGVDGQDVPRIDLHKGGGIWLDDMNDPRLRGAGPGLDSQPGQGRAIVGGQVGGPGKALQQGNIDPNVLFARLRRL